MSKNSGKHVRSGSRQVRLRARLDRAINTPATLGAMVVAVATDIGCVRKNNEDTFRCDPGNGLYLVCDGMGGMAAGEVASQIAADTVLQQFAHSAGQSGGSGSTQKRLEEAVLAANREVLLAAQEPGRKGMGTTLVAAAADGDNLLIANVGDSRAYLLQDGVCAQITRDHSYANEVERVSGLSPDQVSPEFLKRYGSLITRAIGAAEQVEPEFFPVELAPGSVLLLASDGLTRYFEDPAELVPLVSPHHLQESCGKLIGAAREAGGVDNITVLLLSRGSIS